MKYPLIATSLLLLSFSPALSQAQTFLNNENTGQSTNSEEEEEGTGFVNQYDPKYRNMTSSQNAGMMFMLGGYFTPYLSRHPEDSRGMLNLEMRDNAHIGSCVDRKVPEITVEQRDKALDITIKDTLLVLERDSKECNNPEYPGLTIPLDTRQLRADNVEEINIKGVDGTAKFKVLIDDTKFIMTDKADEENILTHTFFNEKTVILSAPSGRSLPEIEDKITALGYKHGFIKIDYEGKNGDFYFTDEGNLLAHNSDQKNNIKLDTIQIDDIFHGANGPYTVKRNVDVFARRPGQYD
jgi:hypothetical protein